MVRAISGHANLLKTISISFIYDYFLMVMAEKRSNIIWNILSSVRLTLVLLIILATTSIIGTVIPQQEGTLKFAQGISPGLVRLLSSLQIFDMYHSIWFRLIICCLALNLIICSINRFPATLRLFRLLPRPDRSKPFENLPPKRSFIVKCEVEEITGRVSELLPAQYRNIKEKGTEKGISFYGDRGRYTLFGVYLVHLSVLFILIGAIIGSIFGFEAYLNIAEGEEVDSVALRDSAGHNHKTLGFSVYCKEFFVDFYDNGSPKEYRSELSFIIDGKTVKQGSLLVNHPITFRGITFYQSSYGTLHGSKVRLAISQHPGEHKTTTLEVEKGHPFQLPGNEEYFQVVEMDGNLKGMMGPAALISIKTVQGEETSFWIFRDIEILRKRFPEVMFRSPKLNPSAFKPYTFYLDEIETRYYTGLQVNRDPGVSFVWTGFFIIMVGLFITFFTSHRRVWVRITRDKEGFRVSVAGKANKNPVGMERELDRLINKLQNLFINMRG